MTALEFRVWNKIDRAMIDKPNSPRVADGVLVCNEDYIIMQYTGLNDKDGAKIFEGDVVEEVWITQGRENRGRDAVEKSERGGWHPFEYSGGGEADPERCEVIGNIYENPELLEEAQ